MYTTQSANPNYLKRCINPFSGFLFSLLFFISLPGMSLQAQTLTRGPYLQNGNSSAVSIRWRTSTATGSVVKYGTSSSNLSLTASNSTAKTEHEIRIAGLAANTKYYYSVGNGSVVFGSGTDYFFVTAPTSAKPTRIWVLGDSGTRTSSQSAVRDAYYSFTGSRHTDLWLMLGDNAYDNGTDAEYQTAVYNMYPTMLRKSVLWSTIGNHDARNTTVYYNNFTLPASGEAGGVSSGSEAYYSFNYGNIHLVCLDSQISSRSATGAMAVGSSRVDLQACKLEYSIVSPK